MYLVVILVKSRYIEKILSLIPKIKNKLNDKNS